MSMLSGSKFYNWDANTAFTFCATNTVSGYTFLGITALDNTGTIVNLGLNDIGSRGSISLSGSSLTITLPTYNGYQLYIDRNLYNVIVSNMD